MDAAQAERRQAQSQRQVRGLGLFKDPRRAIVDNLVKVQMEQARGGHVPPAELAAAQDARWAQVEPVVYEDPKRPLSVEATKEVVAAMERGHATEAGVQQRIDLIVSGRTPVYETKASKTDELVAMNADVAKLRPKLNALGKETGVGNSVPLAREMLAESAERRGK
jgi:hypothetical protein